MHEIAAIDLFVVVTLSFRLLYAMVLIRHDRRRIIHFDITKHPTQDWLSNQVSRAFQSNTKPGYLLRDRDALYGKKFRDTVAALVIQEIVTARQSPWQNIYVERVICSIRRECLDYMIVINEHHLRRILSSYVRYYNQSRTHQSLKQDCPESRPIDPPSAGKKIVVIPHVGGLHHRYERRAA